MIKPNEIMDALCAEIQNLFPGEKIYQNFVPKGFSRPSNLVELSGVKLAEIKNGSIRLLYTYKIRDFVPLDDHANSDTQLLDLRTLTIVAWIFGKSYLKVADRAMHVVSVDTEHNMDYTVTTAVLDISFDRSEFAPEQTAALMGQLNLKEAMQE